MDAEGLGQRVAYWRKRRNMTRRLFADRVGRSVVWVDKIERGERALTKLPVLERVADVLGVPVDVLANGAQSARAAECPDRAEIAALRDGLQRYDVLAATFLGVPAETGEPNLASLRRQLRYVWTAFQASDYAAVSQSLAALLAEAQNAAAISTGAQRDEAQNLLAQAYQIAASTARKIGAYDLEWLAADRAIALAGQIDDPVVAGGAAFRLVNALRDNDGSRAAVEATGAAGARLARTMRWADPAHLSVYGHLMLQGAMSAAAAHDRAAAQDLLADARAAAERIGGDRNDYWTAFGPTNVAVHQVCAWVEMDEPGRAVKAAARLPGDALARLPKERHANHLVTLAHAHSHAGQREDATDALLATEARAPKEVRCRPAVRHLVADLLTRACGKPSGQLEQLATRLGVVA